MMFSAADAYERFMGRWSRRLAPLFVRFAGVRDGDIVLDVGAGTGALIAAILSAAPSTRVVGIDASPAYVAFGREQYPDERVRFVVGDAQHLSLMSRSVNATLSLLFINFVRDPHRALREMIAVTRPGGTVAAAVWDYGQGMEMLRVFWDEAVAADPVFDQRDERHMPLCRSGELASLWRSGGLHHVVEEALSIETTFSSFADYWAPFLEKQGPAGAHISGLLPAQRDQLQRQLRARLVGEASDRPIALRARAWAVRGFVE